MTYVSRRTRITVSRWTDECDAEYLLRASRKRSDGRLKRHTSCDDPRAWVNDNCIKNEYLVDLMSNGEFLGKPSFRLFGRFIPVPILFKLAQCSTMPNNEAKSYERQENAANAKCKVQESYSYGTKRCAKDNLKNECDSRNEKNYKAENNSALTIVEWEKNVLEKNLIKCTCLLSKALKKLEQIDEIVGPVNEEIENSRNDEIREAFYRSKLDCICSQNQNFSARPNLHYFSENLLSSKANLKMPRCRRTELLRKISFLRKKLKKICLQEVIHQVRTSQRIDEKCSSHFPVKKMCSCPKQEQIKGLKKNNEKLKLEKKKLLSEMCQACTALNAIKKSSKSFLESRKRNLIPKGNCDDFHNKALQEFGNCKCGCKGSEEFLDSEKLECFESFSAESDLNKKYDDHKQRDKDFCFDYRKSSSDYPFKSSLDCRNLELERCFEDNLNSAARTEIPGKKSEFSVSKNASDYKNSKNFKQLESSVQKKCENSKEKREPLKTVKQSKVKFVCEESPCRKNIYADDLSAFENSLSNQMIILKAIKNIQNTQSFRPSTTPTTKREKPNSQNFTDKQNSREFGCIPKRRVKSETTMKEIEKTLRNYEQRLCDVDVESLECRIEQLKEKSSEACQLRKKLKKVKADAKKQIAVDRENSHRERIRLCTENWELKMKIQRLTKRSLAQIRNIQNLNCILMKFECETEDLKKELSEYQIGFKNQQKYICKCENTLAEWGAEIENLKNHIRKLTAVREVPCSPYQDNRCIQRSRSYSPEKIKERVVTNRPKTQVRGYRTPSEEEVPCCCREHERLNFP